MKRTYLILVLGYISLCTKSQTPIVYFDFLSHNEENQGWDTKAYYNINRTRLITLANYFKENGISWNMQSDWKFLINVIKQDTSLFTTTNGKNILRWMHEDKGVEMDPHAHESIYLYPDVVKLMDSIGLPESKVIGGSIYNANNGMNIWTNLENGQFGKIFPKYFWQPDYLMGGGTPNHINDLKYFGFWNPKDTANYLTHEASNHIRHIGVGCEMKIRDTTTISYFVAQLKDLIKYISDGAYPSDGFYFQTVFFEQADLNNLAFYKKVETIADSMNAIVATGKVQWKTFKQCYTDWETSYGAQKFQWECGLVLTGTENLNNENILSVIYPNPFSNNINLSNKKGDEYFELLDSFGNFIWKGANINQKDFSYLHSGLYILKLKTKDSLVNYKIVKE